MKSKKENDIGFMHERTEHSSLEREFSEAWILEQKNRMLSLIIGKKATKRDRYVAASVIQWLGTNVGFCFLRGVICKAGYDVTGGYCNRDSCYPVGMEPLAAALAKAQHAEMCDEKNATVVTDTQQALFDEAEPH